MRSDRELLELAAKAAGAKNISFASGELALYNPFGETGNCFWNPLVNDGDALRLGAKLKLWLRHRDDGSVNVCWYDERGMFAGGVNEEWGSLRNGDDPTGHIRRAIVRAAAEIAAHPKQHNDGGAA